VPKGPKGQPPIPDDAEARPQRKRLTVSEKRERTAAEWARFIKQAGRKAQRHTEPNDRKYSKKAQSALRRMPPEDFDRLIRHGDDD
jgi:hypothetical protein